MVVLVSCAARTNPAMPTRAIPSVLVLIACAIGSAAVAVAQKSPEPARAAPAAPNAALMTPIEFYLAHGDANACGPGCSDWIAAEGKIDVGAADRFRQLLRKLGDRRPPIYFHSPGGNLKGAIELGQLIRDKKFEVSVGHTVPRDCGGDKQSDSSCEARKRSGTAIEAEISAASAQCNSGCVYALAGGAVRQVPPWVRLGIHDAGLDPDKGLPRGVSLGMAMRVLHARLRSYLREMGIDDALYSATLVTPFESMKLLQREDLVRFGIDRRDFGETPWQFLDQTGAPQMVKRFFVRADGDQPRYVDARINVVCINASGPYLVFTRQRLGSDPDASDASSRAINITIKGERIGLTRTASADFYVRSGRLALQTLDMVGDDLTIELPGAELDRKERGNVTLLMDGFSSAFAKLRPHCAAAPREPRNVSAADAQAAMRVVAQLPHTKAVVSDPQTAAWLQSKGVASAAPAAAAAPAGAAKTSTATSDNDSPTLELTRAAAAAQKSRLDFFYDLAPDCSSAGKLVVRVLEQPQHGTLSIENGRAFTDFPQGDRRAACNAQQSDGTLVFYQPSTDYRGADSITLAITLPAGGDRKRHYAIDVK
jgi:hypothetical protein